MEIGTSNESVATLFSAAQPNGPIFFGQDQFEWSLHYNLLFHPTGLVSPDPFFFSPLVVNYLATQPDKRTWYESALVEGLIIPFARTDKVSGFYELWDHMFKSSLQGHYEKSKEAAKRLDKLKGRATPEYWKLWPDGMGIRFAKLIEERLLLRNAESMIPVNLRDQDADRCAAYLDRTKRFRVDDTEVAMRRLRPEDGLRVSEILYASGRRLLGNDVAIKNVEELLDRMELSPSFTSQDVADAKQFYKTLIELYNENLSNAVDITKNVTDFDVASRIFSEEGTVDLSMIDDGLEGAPIFEDVELPPVSLLKAFKFDFLISARTSREFYEYQDTLDKWTKNSKDFVSRENVTKAVKAYVKRIHTLCRHDHSYFDQYRVTVGYKPAALRLGGQLLAFGASGVGAYAVHEKLMEQTGGFAMAFSSLPEATATVAAAATAFAGGHVAAKAIESGGEFTKHIGSHWLYISKIKRQQATLIARADSSIEVHDRAKPRVRAQIARVN